MRMPHRSLLITLALGSILAGTTARAQTAASGSRPTSGSDRLFLAFIEDATVIDKQWWEGQLEITDGDHVDSSIFRGIVAFQPWQDVEVGGRMGFGSTDTTAGLPDGSGATDLDLWGKYYLGSHADDLEFAVGGVLTVPTGDDSVGLGNDAFGVSAFGAMRYRFPDLVLSAHAGARFNEDGKTLGGPELDGKVSTMLGAGVLWPISDPVTLVGEANLETERLDGGDTDFRLLGGINWRVMARGTVRAAVTVGLSDGAPDAQILGGYAARF